MGMQAASLEILSKAKVPQEQALAFVQVIDLELDARGDVFASKRDIDGLASRMASKQDIDGLKQDVDGLKHDVDGLKHDVDGLKHDVGGLKHDVGGLKQDIDGLGSRTGGLESRMGHLELKLESVKSELVRWVFTCMLGQTAVLLGAAYFLTSLLEKALRVPN